MTEADQKAMEYPLIAADECPKGGNHAFIFIGRLETKSKYYEVLQCTKCQNCSTGWGHL